MRAQSPPEVWAHMTERHYKLSNISLPLFNQTQILNNFLGTLSATKKSAVTFFDPFQVKSAPDKVGYSLQRNVW